MRTLSLALLGTVEGVYDQRPLAQFRTKAVEALLIYLVCQREQAHARGALMVLLWPELSAQSAQGNLRHALYHLRQMIPEVDGKDGAVVPFLLADRKTIGVNPDARFQLDITSFEAGILNQTSLADLETAVALYRADFLTNFYLPGSPNFESWAQARRAELRRRLLNGLTRVADERIKQENFEQAERVARRQLDIDNLREEAHQQLMMVLACNGRRTDALTHYQTMRQLLQDELGIIPSAATEELVESIRADSFAGKVKGGERQVQEDLLGAVPHNLPPQATPFIGRQIELAALDDFLADPQTRLVTILGAGGMGKTRLSLATAERQLARQQFPQGIFFVPLAGLSERERIVSAIAEAMQIRLEKGEPQLHHYLRAKQILLVLDNFEHLLDGSDLLNRLLQAALQLHILVTSRERLRLQGEQIYPIQGLTVDDTAGIDDARALFLHAARRLRPDFQASGESRTALKRLCHLVEGMPLALELAAAWVDLFTLDDITAEIHRNLDFLESDLRDIPARHRSMQAVFDTSWQQLPVNLQQVLAAAAVFRGGFTREAATAVIHASKPDLAALVNKSLLSFDANANRYHIHELLRQYSLARLTNTALRDQHCAYYLDWLVQQEPRLTGPEQDQTEALIDTELDNIQAAVTHAMRIEKIDTFELVMRTLNHFYENKYRPMDGIFFFGRIRTQVATFPETPSRILFWAIAWQVLILDHLGHTDKSGQLWLEGQTHLAALISQKRDTRAEQAISSYIDGFRLYIEQPVKARQLLRQSYDLALEIGDLRLAGLALMAFARAARNQGDLSAAEAAIADSLTLFQTLDYRRGIILAQILLGELAGINGRYDEAEQRLLAGIGAARINSPPLLAYGLTKLQAVYFFWGRFKKAAILLAEDQLLNEESGYTWGIVRNSICLGLLHLHEGRYTEPHVEGKKALSLGQKYGLDFFVCEALTLMAQAQMAMGNYRLAKEHLWESDRICPSRSVGMQTFVAGNHLYWGIVEAALGRVPAARRQLQSELISTVHRKDELNLANVLAGIAFFQATKNEAGSALEYYTLAQQNPFIANSRWFADVVGKRVAAASATLSTEAALLAATRGETMDMWETAVFLQEWLAELD